MRRMHLMLAVAVTATMLAAPTTLAAAAPPGVAAADDGWFIDTDDLAETIDDIDDDPSVQTLSGELAGAAWIAQVPDGWDGDDGDGLVMWAHGYRGELPDAAALTVDPPPAREWLLDQGYAWAASSYRRNSYDPGIGVLDTKLLTQHVQSLIGRADRTYLAGVSMGGHVTAAAIEQFPKLYDGALPACGVLGDVELFDYFLDYNLGAAAFAGLEANELEYPDANWLGDEVPEIKEALSTRPDYFVDDSGTPADPTDDVVRNIWASAGVVGFPFALKPAGLQFREFVEQGSGGERSPFFDVGWDYWHLLAQPTGDFFFALGEGDGTIAGRKGVVGQNSDTDYGAEYGPVGAAIADDILRVDAANRVRRSNGHKPAPIIHGTPSVPVLTMHTIGDLFVPIEMEQIYAEEVAANGREHLLVQRAIRDVGHCTFTEAEWTDAYSGLFDWVVNGNRPDGEDLSDLSDPLIGCEFTKSVAPLPSGAVRAFPCS